MDCTSARSGNADNVLLVIPAGMGNTYDYAVPSNMPNGLYWYHSHRHTVTAPADLHGARRACWRSAGQTATCRWSPKNNIPIRDMALQYNFVLRPPSNGGRQLNNPYWEQWVSTLKPPEGNPTRRRDISAEPGAGELRGKSSKGAEFFTQLVCRATVDPPTTTRTSPFIPQNLQTFTSPTKTIPANPALPENERDVQFTINGQFQPELKVKPRQTEIWVFTNMSDIAFVPLRFTETATGNHPKFAVVGQDGNPYTQVQRPVDGSTAFRSCTPTARTTTTSTSRTGRSSPSSRWQAPHRSHRGDHQHHKRRGSTGER